MSDELTIYLCPEHEGVQIRPASSEPYFGWWCRVGPHALTHLQRRRYRAQPWPEQCATCQVRPADLELPGLLVTCASCFATHPQQQLRPPCDTCGGEPLAEGEYWDGQLPNGDEPDPDGPCPSCRGTGRYLGSVPLQVP